MTAYFPLPGAPVAADALRLPLAREIAQLLGDDRVPHMALVECRRWGEGQREIIVIHAGVERPQRGSPLLPRERLALSFGPTDADQPVAQALRADFPLVPHTNLVETAGPRQLCLYDQPWREVRWRISGARLLQRVQEWLNGTALGTLHADDQALEPFFLGPTLPIVLPFDPHDRPAGDEVVFLNVAARDAGLGRRVLLAEETDNAFHRQGAHADGLPVVATAIRIPPQPHGFVHHLPRTLGELRGLLAPAGTDILETLRARKRAPRPWHQRQILKAHLLLVVLLPKTREPDGLVEDTETWLIYCAEPLLRIGEALGVWRVARDRPALLDGPPDPDRGGDRRVHVLNPMPPFTRERAAEYNGLVPQGGPAIVAVGAGALGSQVMLNLVRAGWGDWTVIDEDYLLPHNLARHALSGFAVGRPKATALATLAGDLIAAPPLVEPIVADVLQPGPAALDAAWGRAAVLLDLAASIIVARHLVHGIVAPQARRLSLFLNPAGTDLVLLAEDTMRAIPLDALDFQYYRLVAGAPALADHLRPPPGRIRYARSCRDVSAALPQELVALHAAIGSRAIRAALAGDGATIAVWRADPADLTVTKIAADPAPLVSVEQAGWRVYTDPSLLAKVGEARAAKLPNETGGVLLGAFDLQHKIIYVVDTLPAPPDSTEYPTLFVRGHAGLATRIAELQARTGGMLEYVGEWHSHPAGASVAASPDDRTVLGWLADRMGQEGLPALMLIAGDADRWGWHLHPQR